MSIHRVPQPPSLGRIIHYVLRTGRRAGEVRAAIVTNVFPGVEGGICNGTVFLDELNDDESERYFGSAKYDDPSEIADRVSQGDGAIGYQLGTWHWPPRV